MNKKQILGLVIAVVLFIITGMASVFTHKTADTMVTANMEEILTKTKDQLQEPLPDTPYIAQVDVIGTIQEQQSSSNIFESTAGYQHNDTMNYIDEIMSDSNNQGLLLYVDSPGGAVYESEELYDKLMEYKETTGRPIWTYMAHYAASGGYMISVSSDYICANKNTVTGSIGVIMSGYDMSGLYEKLGIRYISITSGVNKDSSKMNDEQIAIYQSQVDECYQSFVDKVALGRNMSEAEVKQLADGRTYSATQAKENGLIDDINSFDYFTSDMLSTLNVDDLYQRSTTDDIFTQLFSKAEKLVPRSEAEILLDTAEDMESGVLMYYAK